MPRRLRFASGGHVYHALSRAVGRATLFAKPGDYAAFEKALRQAKDWLSIRLLGFCVLPNHWQLVLWPSHDGDLSEFLRWLTVTPTQRWHAHHHTAGTGPLSQGRFKSFPVQEDDHLLTVLRYVEKKRGEEKGQRELFVLDAQEFTLSPFPFPFPFPFFCPLFLFFKAEGVTWDSPIGVTPGHTFGHGAVKVTMSDGTVFYVDDALLGGGLVTGIGSLALMTFPGIISQGTIGG